jgi:hypothetical protein
MSDLTSLVTEVADQVEKPAFEEMTRRARTRRVRRVGAGVAVVGLAVVVSVVAFSSTSGRPRALPATQEPRSVTASVRPPEQIVNGRNATPGRTWTAPERSGGLTIRAWSQCTDDTLTVRQCDPAKRLGAWEVADASGRRVLVPSGYEDGRMAYAGEGIWVLRPAPPENSSLSPIVAASASRSAPVTLALDPTRTIGMQAAKGRPHVTCPDQPWVNCVVNASEGTLVPIAGLPTGEWAITNARGWWGILSTGQGVVEQPDGSLLRPDLYEVIASPMHVFAEDALDGTIGWYFSSEEDMLPTTPVKALLSTDRGRTWTLRSVPATARAARDWVAELETDPVVLRAVLPDDWRTWPVLDRP